MYKLFQSKVLIPWNTIDKVAVPNIDISDTFFNFKEVPTNNINFKQWNIASIIVDTKDITYFKLIREGGKTTYWYVNKVLRVLKQGFELEIKLDMWLTYTKDVFKKIIELDKKPIIERVYFSVNMLFSDYDIRQLIYYSFYNDDDLIDEDSFQYKQPKVITSQYKASVNNTSTLKDARYRFEIAIGSPIAQIKRFIGDGTRKGIDFPLGYYVVMRNSKNSVFDLYPVSSSFYNLLEPQGGFSGRIDNSISDLLNYITTRKAEGSADFYESDSFQGVYRGPILSYMGNDDFLNYDYVKIPRNFSPVDRYSISLKLHPFSPINVSFPKQQIDITGDLIETYINYSDSYMWGSEIKFRKYFSMGEDMIKNGTTNWKLLFKCTFMGGFLLTPTPMTSLLSEQDMISFGEQLPSPTPEYYNTIKQIQTTFDTGIVNSIVGGIQGVPSAIGKAGANPLWGATSFGNSLFTFGRDIYNIKQQRKQSTWNASGRFMTTSNVNYFDSQKWWETLNNTDATSITQSPDRQGSNINNSCILYELTDNQKEAIKYTLTHYGFQVNNSLPIKKWWELILPQDKLIPIKFDDGWLTNHINSLGFNFNIEEQQEIINQLSSGIRINMEWR